MGFVTQFFIKPCKPALVQQPSGSFTIDRDGKVMTTTLPHSFGRAHMECIGERVLTSLRAAKKAQIALSELVIEFAEMKLVARDLRGGAIIYLEPRLPKSQPVPPPNSIEVDEHFGPSPTQG